MAILKMKMMSDYGFIEAVIGLFFVGIYIYHLPFCNKLSVLWQTACKCLKTWRSDRSPQS